MANIENKLILFLADPQFSKEELKKLQNSLSNKGVDTIFKKARRIKAILSDESQMNSNDSFDLNLSQYEIKVLKEVDLLLRKEAKMTVKESISALSEILNIFPPSSKKSFQDQILYMIDKKDGSEVINAAHKVRNLEIHNTKGSHWPLRDDE